MKVKRKRTWCLVVVFCIVIVGLYSRSTYPFPMFLKAYLGDVLWTSMVYFLLVLCFPNVKASTAFIIALLGSFFVEFSQLISNPTLDYLRTTFLRYIIGQGFVWSDLICYCVGAIFAYILDVQWIFKEKKKRP
ncbi:MAG: DUF2809 domain-containing protein [Longicatena sp.]